MLDDYQFKTSLEVRIGDVNYGGHVGNTSFIQYFQEARIKYLNQFGFSEINLGDSKGLVLTKVYCEFNKEAFYGNRLDIYVKICEIKKASFKMNYKIICNTNQVASGYSVQAAFDYNARKLVSLPNLFTKKIKEYETI